MTRVGFVLISAVMLLAALVWVLWPLYRSRNQAGVAKPMAVMTLVGVCMLVVTVALYMSVNNWSWNGTLPVTGTSDAQAMASDAQAQVTAFTARVTANPADQPGWVLLGNAHMKAGNADQARAAYQQAFDLSEGQNLDARAGLVEALVLADPNTPNGRAALLIEEGLQRAPQHPKLLWYGGLVAMQMQNLPLARDRFQAMLMLNPPDNVRAVLTNQVAQLNERLGMTASADSTKATPTERKVTVAVRLAPTLKPKLTTPLTLFILARNPAQPGPPLAVERHSSIELPLTVELTAADAMLPSRTLQQAEEVEIVARLSASGMPTEQSGDYVGKVRYSFANQGEQGAVSIEIDQQVP